MVTQFVWGDLNENGNFNDFKPVMHGYNNLHGGDLSEDENFKKETIYFVEGSKD